MVAVKTGFPSPSMPGMPAPMQPMGGMRPMALPAGQTPVPASVPPMPLAGFPPPPVNPPMAQQGSNAPRRRRFGDSLEGMLGRNMFAPQQQMVAPGMPMMRTPMPRPMQMGGIVQGFANGGNANQQAAASMMSAGIGNVGGKAITPSAQNIQKTYKKESLGRRLAKKRREAEQAIRDAEAAAALAAQQTSPAQSYSAFDDDYEDFTPTSDQLNQDLANQGLTNITSDTSNVNFGTTSTGQDFTTAAQADTDVSGAEFVAAGGLGSVDSGSPTSPPPVTLGSTEAVTTYTDIMGNTHSSAADRDRANLGYQQASYQQGSQALRGLMQGFKQFGDFDSDEEAYRRAAANFAVDPPENLNVYNLQNVPDIFTSMFPPQRPILPPKVGSGDTDDSDTLDPRGDQIVSPTGTGIGIPPAITGGSDKSTATPTGMITSYTDKDGNTTVDDPETPENEAMLAQLGLLTTLRENQANPNIKSRDPTSVNAAEAAFLQEALGQMEFNKEGKLVSADPNFLEQVIGKVIRNLTFGMFDPNDPQKREDAKAILDAYRETGKFIYDGEQMSIDELIEASKGDGIEPAVIGVGDLEGNTVGFDDGTGFRNTKEGTQNILTGSFDVFDSSNTATTTTTKDDDDDNTTTTGEIDLGHTVDEDGNKICNTEGYVYNPETKICELPKEEEVDGTPGSGIGTGTSGESFEDVLKRVVVAAPDVAPISANVRPMQEGGMAGLNRAADNFLQALAG